MTKVYTIIKPTAPKVPIIISVPHAGTAFPEELQSHFKEELITPPDDTDHFVERLYDFVSELGITLIYANYSRWVIDLNRSPENQSLYNDGRIITALTPTTDFFGNDIYVKEVYHPNQTEVERRKALYFQPYYQQLTALLKETKEQFGQALLWDAHSIRRHVPTIRTEAFPDLILGNNDEQSAKKEFIEVALTELGNSDFELKHNTPFKGGNITRHFGQPAENIHALQLEMAKPLYMDDTEQRYDGERAEKVRKMLRRTFTALLNSIS